MLSYRHGFHAGNYADVLKHSVLIQCIHHYLKKDKPFLYVDTHSGAGSYRLDSDFAQKNREHERGVSKLPEAAHLPKLLEDYRSVLNKWVGDGSHSNYPGSPMIASQLLRHNDQLRLHELHPRDFEQLQNAFRNDKRATVINKDGYRGLIKAFPPPARRSVVLIDPSYEIDRDYVAVPLAIDDALFKFPSATILIWYPMLETNAFLYLKEQLLEQGHNNWLWVELCVRAPSKGMYGSGLWVVNPPWTLPESIEQASDTLAGIFGESEEAEVLVGYNIP